ncbi:MAG: hypothetical protein CSA07_01465 [Bacteroidia bacterium]|nr:MAG: hypothetical protein CSA07_01465 [Bacteroidia bacterium]
MLMMKRKLLNLGLLALLSLGVLALPACDKKDKDSKPAAGSGSSLQVGNGGNAGEDPGKTPEKPSTPEDPSKPSTPEDPNKPGTPDPGKPSTPQPPQTDPALGIQWVKVEGGKFMMGSPDDEEGRERDEGPQHEVELSGFWMSATEVTNAQYNAFLKAMEDKGGEAWEKVKESGSNHPDQKSEFKGARQPVVNVSWDDAKAFCDWVGKGATLPTEAQWEYACRAGSTGRFCFGEDEAQLGDYAWYRENAGRVTHAVGGKKPNAWGLYDMHGNVWEWCSDYWLGAYTADPVKDPAGPAAGPTRVLRGGECNGEPRYSRSAFRSWYYPFVERELSHGFRLVAPLAP